MKDKIRKFRLKDLNRLVFLLDKEWDLGDRKSVFGRKVYSLIYAMEILKESDFLFTCEVNSFPVGFVGYGKNGFSLKNFLLRFLANFCENLLWLTPFLRNTKEMKNYNWSYGYLPPDLDKYFDNELTILILDKVYRGNGYGKKMFLKICKLATVNGLKRMKINSDETSNWKFYLHNGCNEVMEKEIFFEDGDSEKVFVFEKDLTIY